MSMRPAALMVASIAWFRNGLHHLKLYRLVHVLNMEYRMASAWLR